MKIAIIGANSRIGRETIKQLLEERDVDLHLFLKKAEKLADLDLPKERTRLFEGDAEDVGSLEQAIDGTDLVLVNLEGPMDTFAKTVKQAMLNRGVKRLVFVLSLGILNEVGGFIGKIGWWIFEKTNPGYTEIRKRAAKIIENSDLDYTILRPTHLTNSPKIAYRLVKRGELFKRSFFVSRASVAAVVVDIAKNPKRFSRDSIGIGAK